MVTDTDTALYMYIYIYIYIYIFCDHLAVPITVIISVVV